MWDDKIFHKVFIEPECVINNNVIHLYIKDSVGDEAEINSPKE